MIVDITIPVIAALVIIIIFYVIVYFIDKYQEDYFYSKHPDIKRFK
jgi:hypothetical protein